MTRRQQRENVFKLLFRIEFNDSHEMPDQVQLFFEDFEKLQKRDKDEIEAKYDKIVAKLEDIDAIINEVSTGWKTSRMSKVDLTIIRLAVYEIKFDEDVPASVAINEAVEISKVFGGDDSPSFVNGILAKVV